jgi:hypothetical protein
MESVMGFIKNNGYAAFLGGALGCFGITWNSWEFYAILIPTVILVTWKAN